MIWPRRALIVAKPGPLREGLRAALSAMPCMHVVGEVDKATLALRIHLDPAPALILVSADGPGLGAADTWEQIRAQWPEARYIILADTVQQQEEAQAAGADLVLLKGFAASQLFVAVETLMGEPGEGLAVGGMPEEEE